jgi:hypothetical protein
MPWYMKRRAFGCVEVVDMEFWRVKRERSRSAVALEIWTGLTTVA